MKRTAAISIVLSLSLPALAAQQSAPQHSQTIQMECRDFGTSGSYLAPNETLIDGRACHPVSVVGNEATPKSPLASTPATNTASDAVESAPKGFVLEDATPVHLVLSENLSSATAITGQTVEFEVVDDIVVNDLLVIPHGSTAWATITDAEHKKHLGRGGKLDLNIDKVRLADGEKALLRGVKDTQGGGHTGAMTGAIVATSLVIWPAAPFFLFMHGKDINIPKGTQITAFVQGDVRLDASKFQKQLAVAK